MKGGQGTGMLRRTVDADITASPMARVFTLIAILCLSLMLPPVALSQERSPVEKKIIGFVKNFYGNEEDIQIKLTNMPSHLNAKVKVRNVNFAKVPDGQGDGLCLVEIDGNEARERTIYVAFKVYKKRQLFVLKHGARRGDILTAGDLAEKEAYLTGSTVYPSAKDEVVGKRLRRDLPAGTVLTPQVLEDRILVKSGDTVSIVAENSRLAIHANGRALDRGRMGDTIRVKNLTSGKEILGKVTGGDVVSVEF